MESQHSAAGRHRLSSMLQPRSIALVGATEKSFWSQIIYANFQAFGYGGKLFAVNRGGKPAHGLPTFGSCAAIGETVDLAVVYVPQDAIIEALADIAAASIRNAVLITSGYAEVGPDGARLQQEMLAHARALGVTLWGPNCLGFNNFSARIPVGALPPLQPILPGQLAVVSQSGATAFDLYEFAHSQNIGLSFLAATGNEAEISVVEVIDFLLDQDHTQAIAIFCETIRDPAGFIQAARKALQRGKPLVILKVGHSELASEVAQAHTGSLAGDHAVFEAICNRHGVISVRSAEDLIVTAGLLSTTGPLRAQGLGVVSLSGGACTLVADAAEEAGVRLPAASPQAVIQLREVLPSYASTLNPLDITGAAVRDPALFERVIPIVAHAPEIGLLAISIPVPTVAGQGLPPALQFIGRALAVVDKPAILVTTCLKALNDFSRNVMAVNQLPHVVTSIGHMVRAVGHAFWWSRQWDNRSRSSAAHGAGPTTIPVLPREASSSERAVLDWLQSLGVPVIPGGIATSAAEATRLACSIAAPVALKIASPDIAHKTEAGGVRLHIAPQDAAAAFDAMVAEVRNKRPDARLDGAIVSPMRSGGIELLVGVKRDANWGLTLAVGLGGVLVELLSDVALTPLPVSKQEVIQMLGRLRGAKLLQGFRGGPPADLEATADIIVRIGEAAMALGPGLESLEINPLWVLGNEIEALDALVTWRDIQQS
jgi:acyl-CoA synthetase (NDP forming)